ncbi:MAG: transglutaminase domain-containing protein [Prevotellaceae bacterium]|jgi:transglutaminase-like putative cysteine protease|nr:transglutaminase domain-containing protein [Prevotellaceae bacterium]
MKQLLFFVIVIFALSCSPRGGQGSYITPQQIETAITNGSFTKAESMIKEYLYLNNVSAKERQKWLFQIEKMQRIRLEFTMTESDIITYLLDYYDSIPNHQLRIWEEGKALEYRMIDGEKRYFNHAARNLFRISLTAKKRWDEVHGNKPDSLTRFLAHYIPSIVLTSKKQTLNLTNPVTMEVTYTLTVKPNAVPGGEWLRVWMPMPRTDSPSHTHIQLISANPNYYMISPDHYAHKTIYMEKRAVVDEPTIFTYTFSYTSSALWASFDPAELKMYNTQSDLYQQYTSQQAPHILFTDNIKKITQEVVGNEQNPFLKVQKIYNWIDKNYPWASSVEYSTIDNIPEYVLDNKHGDCGQVSLLFITMARCAGVPAKWQSGWMMHPGNKSLHDWAQVYFQGVGWVPVDQSFGRIRSSQNPDVYWFYSKGIDAYRLVVNDDIGQDLYPLKIFPRSETVDFQRGEVEWKGGNLYFPHWDYQMDISYKPTAPPTKEKSKTTTSVSPYLDAGYRMPPDYRWSFDPFQELRYQVQTDYYSGYSGEYPQHTSDQRSYLRQETGDLPASFYQDVYSPSSGYEYNSPNPYPARQDYSVSEEYSYMQGVRSSQDRYIPPSERYPLPNNGNRLPYRRDLYNPQSVYPPSMTDPQRSSGINPYPDYGYRYPDVR